MASNYEKRGVSSSKDELHGLIATLDKGFFPGAFCKAVEDVQDPSRVLLMHADGAGTKSSLAYLYWKETGDVSVFRGIAQDAFVMNLDDLLCVGAVNSYYVSSTIGRNARRIPKEVLEAIIEGTQECMDLVERFGGIVVNTGGETADVGDLVKTIVVDSTFGASLEKKRFVNAAEIRKGLVIVGLASDGQTSYETQYNSGIGSNGLTSARHDLLSARYRHYEETYDEGLDKNLVYSGSYVLEAPLEGTPLSIGKALLSPTRTYYPVIKALLEESPDEVLGMVHCSGGGQTKCRRFGEGLRYVKDHMFPFPPIFQLLSQKNSMEEMFRVFNCGHRMEVYTTERGADTLMSIARSFNLGAKIVGHVERSVSEKNQVLVEYDGSEYLYS